MATLKEALERKNIYHAGDYDVIVIGAGHAGCEAALATARLGFKTILFTMNLDAVANMPCNPNIGGTAKGQLVREIDALGGQMGKLADLTFIQSRMLNASKGPAVLSPRAQIDRREYQAQMKLVLEKQNNLDLRQAEVVEILFRKNDSASGPLLITEGVITKTNALFGSKCIIVATGTYMESRIIIGEVNFPGGPDGMFPSKGLAKSLLEMGVKLQRFKTGTPVRINRNTIDFDKLQEQPGDEMPSLFSFENEDLKTGQERQQISCYLTWTTPETKKTIMDNIDRSPLFSGEIEGTGPRYCPSIEDKYVKFPTRDRHQIFIEPTGANTMEMYIQGMSSSMPEEIQNLMLKSIPGLEESRIMRPAYAIEYECVVPQGLHLSLEHKEAGGLFCAGQINGSSGYEEAGGQGLIAGINAAMKLKGENPLILDRSEAYIGVLIDDLVTKGTGEPYRMMTSRAEYRLVLRQDNADERLTHHGYKTGLISKDRYIKFTGKMEKIDAELKRLKTVIVKPTQETNTILKNAGSTMLKTGSTMWELLKRPEIKYDMLSEIDPQRPDLEQSVKFEVEVKIKYEGYISLEQDRINKFKRLESKRIPENIEYSKIKGLRTEAKQKLEKIRPDFVGQAGRISGVSPADISVLLVYLEGKGRK